MPAEIDWSQVEPVVSHYQHGPAVCHDYDPRSPLVAAHIAAAINRHLPDAIVEHIGSTSVLGCAGKGVVDLMLLYNDGQLEVAKSLLAALGFQPQPTRDPFPESRPMRIGAIEFDGATFRLHVHVIAVDSPEVKQLRAFRDRLRANPELRANYVICKRKIIAAGVTDSIDYSIEKGSFIQRELGLPKSESRNLRPEP